jgi:hypothetical protein
MTGLVETVKADHQAILEKVERLVDHYHTWPLGEHGAGKALHALVAAESRHETAEAQLLWPVVRDLLPDYWNVAEMARKQEGHARGLLHRLHKAKGTDRSADMVPEVAQAVRDHVRLEDSQVLAALASALSRNDSLRLGLLFERGLALGPTRPHPRIPPVPGILSLVGPLTRRADRVRDFLRIR